jgi:hypothetical protein
MSYQEKIEFDMRIDLSTLYTEEEFDKEFPCSPTTYQTYRSRNRESHLKQQLTLMRFKLRDQGYTHGEIVRSILDEAQSCCKKQP